LLMRNERPMPAMQNSKSVMSKVPGIKFAHCPNSAPILIAIGKTNHVVSFLSVFCSTKEVNASVQHPSGKE